MNLHNDLNEFIGLLISHKVDFLVVGGHAVAFHGYPRYTGDIDVLVRPESDNARRVLAVLAEFGFGNLDITEHDFTTPENVIQLGYPPNRIDLLTSISGVSFESAWNTRTSGKLAGHEISYLGFDALLQNKRKSNRTQDRLDVNKLTEIKSQDEET